MFENDDVDLSKLTKAQLIERIELTPVGTRIENCHLVSNPPNEEMIGLLEKLADAAKSNANAIHEIARQVNNPTSMIQINS